MKNQQLSKLLLLISILLWSACQKKPSSTDMIVVNKEGEITLFGEKIELEGLKTALQDSLIKMPTLPEKIPVKYVGEVLMGMRGEVETELMDAISGAKQFKQRIIVETQQLKKEKGTDCDKDRTLRTNCATINFKYPLVKSGTSALQDSANKWVTNYLIGILTGSAEEGTGIITSLDAATKVFFDTHEGYKGSDIYGAFEASCENEVLLNDGKYLTLAMDAYTFQGGAHGSPLGIVTTFDIQTDNPLTWDDLVTDKAALKILAEKKFREERPEVFEDGFDFGDGFDFKLPDNFGLVKDGIYFHYQHYEVGPYVIGSTTFVLSFTEIGNFLKQGL